MVRNLYQHMWCRVSNDAGGRGFSFRTVGSAFIHLAKQSNLPIEALETVFVTSGKEDLKLLQGIGVQVEKIIKEVVENRWKIQGYDINCSALNCECCGDKTVCDDIREALRARRVDGAGSTREETGQ
jgi:CO dehydrogenase/acetyl-CoA synthase beta subunit